MYNKITTLTVKVFQYTFVLKGKDTLYIGIKLAGTKDNYRWSKESVSNPSEVWEQIGLRATAFDRSVCGMFYN